MAAERKEKIIRVLQILQTTDQKTPINALQIVDKLENEYVIGKTDRRSIYRDVKMLQYCGYPIEQAKDRRKGWYTKKHAFDDWEIKVMMDATQQAKCISEEEASCIREKLLNLTSDRSRKRFLSMMMPNRVSRSKVDTKFSEYIETMLEAMYLHKKIEFQYIELNDRLEKVLRKEGRYYQLNLYMIYWSNNNYYLIGCHDHHDGLANYRLDRVENLRISEEKLLDAKEKLGVDPKRVIDTHIEKSVDHYGGKLIRIEIEYEPTQATNAILYDFVDEDVRVRLCANGKCRAIFKKMDSVTLVGWFMQHANMFRVVKPDSLRQQIVEQLESALKQYME